MANETEPRALGAALAAPAFVTRGHGLALHAANRHVERWAPEANAGRVRSMRSLGFVDRLVAPWIETAQRSASLRILSQYHHGEAGERPGPAVSWVFPRPWYQDELDWMAAARQAPARPTPSTPSLITTRGTFVAPAQAQPRSEAAAPSLVMPAALYEYVAPSLSIAAPPQAPIAGVGYGGEATREAYSPLVSLAAVQAAELMSRTVAPLAGMPTAGAPGLRSMLSAILQRAAMPRAHEMPATRLAMMAPELVTPPAPRPDDHAAETAAARAAATSAAATSAAATSAAATSAAEASSATRVAERYAEQRTRIVELQRIAEQSAHREQAARVEVLLREQAARAAQAQAQAPTTTTTTSTATADAARAARAAEAARIAEAAAADRQRTGTTRAADLQRQADAARTAEQQRQVEADAAERARLEERIAQRLAERTGAAAPQRLHEQARAEAAAHVRAAAAQRSDVAATMSAAPAVEQRVSAEVSAAVAGLPPELAALIAPAVAQRPERALQAIHDLNNTLRAVELLARSSATGAAFEPTRGPRLMMPAGLGGLVSAVDRAQVIADRPAMLGGARPLAALSQFVAPPATTAAGATAATSDAQVAGFDAPMLAAMAAHRAAVRDVRVPALSWLSSSAGSASAAGPAGAALAPTTALGATASASPAALSHVAWADRWLARFAGAAPQSLDIISASAAAAPAMRLRSLAEAAPSAVFVAPEFLRGDLAADRTPPRAVSLPPSIATPVATPVAAPAGALSSAAAPSLPAALPPDAVPSMRLINQPVGAPIRRFDDDAETPDDVFAAIAAAASRGRAASRPGQASTPAAAPVAPVSFGTPRGPVPTLADLVAHAAPSAPGAGLSAQLASSPFASSLRHILALPSAASFDVRSLFGAGLGATYLAGLLGASSHELEIGAQMAPRWASWSEAPMSDLDGELAGRADRIDRSVPGFEPAYVSVEAPDEHGALDEIARETAARTRAQAAGLLSVPAISQATGLPTTLAAGLPTAQANDLAAGAGDAPGISPAVAASIAAAMAGAPMTTLRSALLSWEVVAAGGELGDLARGPIQTDTSALQLLPLTFATPPSGSPAAGYADAAMSASAARMMVESMTLPMLADTARDQASDWAAPGMLADRAHAWSVAQERSTADLALDFVAPELVLAARVYGLGPAEAAQAARLALAGPGQLGAMASTVDRTFVEALAIEREARTDSERRHRVSTSAARADAASAAASSGVAPSGIAPSGVAPSGLAPTGVVPSGVAPIGAGAPGAAAITTAFPTAQGDVSVVVGPNLPASTGTAFGVGRHVPRGAFLWPSATVAALGMSAAGPDGQLSMSVAALELLAAQAVAELGTYAALYDADAAGGMAPGAAPRGSAQRGGDAAELIARGLDGAGAFADGAVAAPSGTAAGTPRTGFAGAGGMPVVGGMPVGTPSARAAGSEPAEADVLGAAAAVVPAARRARFEALYIALSQSNDGRQWSPAARAARALALAGRDDTMVSARERAATAWDVLPVVYASDLAGERGGERGAAGADAEGSASAAAAAELLSSYVAPSGRADEAGAPFAGSGSAGSRRGAARTDRRTGAGTRDLVGITDESSAPDLSYIAGPGLGRLSARAGEALGAYVTPVAAPAAPRERPVETTSAGAVLRAPTAAPEYVQTGRSGGRFGGGEVEIPSWFEAAARKMLAEQSGDGISLAELTLVTAAPASHVAASTRSAPSASPAPSAGGPEKQTSNAPQIDIEKLSNEVYRNILVLMDIARARNGDPYL